MRRRTFLAAGAVTAAIATRVHAATLANIGVQLYTVRDLLQRDFEGTLARIAAIGYRSVEFGGLEGPSPKETLAMLKRHGLTAPSGHAPFDALERALPRVLEDANAREQKYVVCPFLDESRRRTLDDWKRLCATFNAIGEQARRAGLAFAYHNHDFEFAAIDGQNPGQLPYELLLARTDPALVGMELDLYWMTHAGHDPVAWFRRHPGRFPLLHLKDATREGAITDVGRGTIDFKRILGAAGRAGVAHCFVEHDDATDPLRSIETSFAYLRKLDL
jgi:sugar phosphate isomerase/epimerase